MRASLLALALMFGVTALSLSAQSAVYTPGAVMSVSDYLPSTCNKGQIVSVPYEGGFYFCVSPDKWRRLVFTLLKDIENMPNNTFVDVATITVPNVSGAAQIRIDLLGSLGNGGAIGAFEASTGRVVLITITRVKDRSTDASINVLGNAPDARIPGGAGIGQGTQLTAVVGAATETQTLTLQYRITRGTGTSDNHSASIRGFTVVQRMGAEIVID